MKTPVLESLFNKAAGPRSDSSTGNFPVNLQNFLEHFFFKSPS